MALEQAGLQLIAQGAAAYISDLNKADHATTGFYKTLGDAGPSANGFQQVITGALRHVGAALVDFAAQGVKAIGGFVKDSIGLAGDFESGMLNFQAVAGKDVDAAGLEEFRDLFLDIGKRLPVSTSEVQMAATEMIKGGIDPATVAAGGLEQNIQFAAAAMEGDLVKAAEISSKIMGGWAGVGATAAEKADFLTHATDMLAKAANASATDVEGLSQGIFNAQGIARTAGVSFDDLTTTLAALAPRFASSSEAGNSLKNMIARLQPQTKTAAGYMLDLGLITEEGGNKFYDASGKFVGFEQTALLLQESLAGLTEQQRALYLQQIFGNDAMGSAAALAEMGAAGYQEMADALANANGVADAAALKQQGFNTSLDNAKGSVEALQITLGSYLLPILGDLLDNYIAPGVNMLTDLASALFGDKEAFDKLSPTMQGVAQTIEQLFQDVQAGIAVLSDIGAEIDSLIGSFAKAESESGALQGAVDDLNGVWSLALKVIGDVGSGYMAIMSAVLPQIQQFIADHGEEIDAFFTKTWNSVIQIVTTALELYDAIVPPVLNAIAGFISAHGEEIQKVMGGVWTMITSIISGALDTIQTVLKLALDLINGDWDAAWQDISHIVDVQIQAITGFVSGFFEAIAGIFNTSMGDILQLWEDNWAMLVNIATETDWGAVGQNAVDGILEGLKSAWGSLVGWITDKMSSLVDDALEAIGAHSPATAFMPVGDFAVQGIMAGFEGAWPQLTALVSQLGDDLVDQATSLAETIQGAIGDAFGATASINRQKVANLKAVEGLRPGLQAGVQSQIDAAEKIAQAMDDPKEAQAYFKMRSQQLIELAKLNDAINAETDAKKRAQLQAEYDLINAAQQAELKQFDANAKGASATEDIAGAVNQMLAALSKVNLTDAQIKVVDLLSGLWAQLQGIQHRALGGPVEAGQPYWVGENGPELFMPQVPGSIMDALSSRQSSPMSAGGMAAGNSYSNSQSTTLNMPIYTNQSPSVLQASMAIAGAALL